MACLLAPGMPAVVLTSTGMETQTEMNVWVRIVGDREEVMLPKDITFDQAIEMVEESAQANLDQALTLLARKLKGPWQAKK